MPVVCTAHRWTSVRRLSIAVCASIVALLSLPAASLAADAPCAATKPVFSARKGLERLGAELRRKAEVRILAIGSSSTAGVGASSPALAYPAQLQRKLAALTGRPDIEVDNAGIGGEAADITLQRLETQLAEGDYDLVIWQVGTNDALRGGDEASFRAQLARGIAAVRRAKADLVLLDQQFFPTVKDPARYERFVNVLGEVAQTGGVPLFSRFALMKAWGERSMDDLRAMLSSDGFHMSDRGYGCVAELLAGDLLSASKPQVARSGTAAVAAVSR
ncbi:SGNH/GDSL hydrolase family protein [Salinarimonas soli]|uniref:SGNH/GDSL hydrolase family protein n=1 Tax=Salinarimonas soli TaxID=1638099 RepID=A0A5B2VEX3_9HYPH|nr:GDSL-type esterase/lipase family protein [Salinarimonas soli]KAA2236747.1 SGNH/GDSL hydrolase family protein [Salinarimonas soli]